MAQKRSLTLDSSPKESWRRESGKKVCVHKTGLFHKVNKAGLAMSKENTFKCATRDIFNNFTEFVTCFIVSTLEHLENIRRRRRLSEGDWLLGVPIGFRSSVTLTNQTTTFKYSGRGRKTPFRRFMLANKRSSAPAPSKHFIKTDTFENTHFSSEAYL